MTSMNVIERDPVAHGTTHPITSVAEHAVFLLYPFQCRKRDWPVTPTATLGSLAGAGWLPAVGECLRETETRPLWLRKNWPVGDLYHKASQQLGAGDEPDGVWTLDSQRHVQQWLSGPSGSTLVLQLPLSVAAQGRLQRCDLQPTDALSITFGSVRLVPFRTGQGLLIVEIHLAGGQELPAPLLVEAITALCHDRGLRWRLKDGKEVSTRAGNPTFRLAEQLTDLIGDVAAEPLQGRRLFSYTYAAFDQRLADTERQMLLARLARKFTDDYRLADPRAGLHEVRVFDTVTHAASVEGCVTLVERIPAEGAKELPSFLSTFRSEALERRYLPIAAINLHAREALLALTHSSGFWPNMAQPATKDVERLHRLREDILAFRLGCRLSRVSPIGMHNAFHEALGNAFGLEPLLADVNQDALEIGAYLEERAASIAANAAQRNARPWRWIPRLVSAALVVITLVTFGKLLLEALHFDHTEWARWVLLVVSSAAGLVTFWKGDLDAHTAKHAAGDNVLHQNLGGH
ncbi:hypothetical protein SAMN02982994_5921 [Azospirillum lipoferum]|nr:hypothetical protein SAMN02982994_5921 [Azospirillum lipoferum]